MVTGELKRRIDALWLEFWQGGITNPLTVIEQITFLMYARLLDINETRDENRQKRTKKSFQRRFKDDEQNLRWSHFRHLGAEQMLPVVRDKAFPHFKTTAASGSAFAEFMKDAQLMIQKPSLLVKAVNMIHELPLLTTLRQIVKSAFVEMFVRTKWRTKALWEVVKPGTIVTYGIVQAGPEHPGGIPYIRTGDIKNGEIVADGLRCTAPELAEKFGRSRVEVGEIVMSIRATVGTTAFVPASLHGANLTQGTARIAPGPETTKEYLISFLRSARCQQWISRQVKGATFREITLSKLRELEVPLPPIEMQQSFSELYQGVESTLARSQCRTRRGQRSGQLR